MSKSDRTSSLQLRSFEEKVLFFEMGRYLSISNNVNLFLFLLPAGIAQRIRPVSADQLVIMWSTDNIPTLLAGALCT